jgi:hypothetical protein
MSVNARKYRALPGRSRRYFGADSSIHRLFLGPDHLLYVVRSMSLSEVYKRFYLKDIQALAVTRTNSGKIANAVLGAMFSVSVLAVLAGTTWRQWEYAVVVLAGSPALLAAILLVGNIIAGPTCRFQINTAVQVEYIYGAGRLRAARKLLAILQPLIEQAQGPLAAPDLDLADPALMDAPVSSRVNSAAGAPAQRPAPAKAEPGNYHLALFVVLLLFAASNVIDIFWQHHIKNTIDGLLMVPLVIFILIAIVRQQNSTLPASVRGIVWAGLGYTAVNLLITLVMVSIYMVEHPEIMGDAMRGNRDLLLEGPQFVAFFTLSALVYSVLGLLGTMRLLAFRSSQTGPTPPVQPGGGDGA